MGEPELATCRVAVRDGLELMWVETPSDQPTSPPQATLALGQHQPFRVLQRRTRGTVRHDGLHAGEVIVIPTAQSVVCGKTGAYMGVVVEPRVLLSTADSMGIAVPETELRYRFGVTDHTLGYLIPALVREQHTPSPGGSLYTDALTTQLMVHLVRTHSGAPGRATAAAAATSIPPARLRSAIDFIHDHLDQPFTVADVARVIDLSPYHFSRAFKRAIGEAPHQYVLTQRLQRAHRLIADSTLSIADVAIQTGFYDQSHFGYHFKRHFGVTPGTLRRGKDLPAR